MSNIPSLTLNTNASMPLLGLGVYKATAPGEVEGAIATALDLGYRLIDTASAYKNEEGVGRGIRSSSVPRKELFITTKLWNTAQRIGDIDGAFQRSLDRLGLDYVDLYLIHWPVPGCFINSWQALERIRESGQAKAIGVSNFEISHLEALFQTSGIVPAVNQIEYHPLWNQSDLYEYCKERGIAVQAYAPLARGAYLKKDTMIHIGETYGKVGIITSFRMYGQAIYTPRRQTYGKSPAQIGLRWLVQKGISAIPKSVNPERIAENADIFDFELTDMEMKTIDALDEKFRSAGIPEDMQGFVI